MPTPIKKMPMMGVRQFRDTFPTLTEPVRVIRSTRKVEVLGVWTPEKREVAPLAKDAK